jgi:hypothetical protein
MQEVGHRLANRHIAKLFDRLDEAGISLPEMVKSTIRRQMHMLAKDVVEGCKEGAWNGDNKQEKYQ